MKLTDFVSLAYKDQLAQLNQAGKLKFSFMLAEYQFTLYQLYDFFVELKSKMPEMYFEKMMTMQFDDLPTDYRNIISV